MLFSSFIFIFIFLPSTLFIFYALKYFNYKQSAKIILIAASFTFYGYFKIDYLPILISSIIINYYLAKEVYINKFVMGGGRYNKILLILGLIFNIGLLIAFKYTDFLLDNFNAFSQLINLNFDIPLPHILLPLALSFITFQQISFLLDCYNAKNKNDVSVDFIDYCLFVSFFPQLIAGPIVYHKEMMPQFSAILKDKNLIIYENIAKGIFIFSIGLFKKVCIADSLAKWVNSGFSIVESGFELDFIHSWATSLGYTFQLYFDFSGYCDMAIGLALLFSIKLPINFYSPYKSENITDFWRKWHITLGRFFKQYLYIPLGGNRISTAITLRNLFIVAFISGVWHGAGFGFIIWGILHGFALVIHRIYRNIFNNVPNNAVYKALCVFITFNFVNIAWIFFRSENLNGAFILLKGMFSTPKVNEVIYSLYHIDVIGNIFFIAISFIIVFNFKNSIELLNSFKQSILSSLLAAIMIYISILTINASTEVRFLYFNF